MFSTTSCYDSANSAISEQFNVIGLMVIDVAVCCVASLVLLHNGIVNLILRHDYTICHDLV